LQIQKYRRGSNRTAFGEPEFSLVLKEDVLKRLFDYLHQQQALGQVDLGSEYLAIPVTGSATHLSAQSWRGLALVLEGLLENNRLENLLNSDFREPLHGCNPERSDARSSL